MGQPLETEIKSLRSGAETFADKASSKAETVANQVKDSASEFANVAAEKGQQAARQIERSAITAYASTKRFVEEQPMLALASAAAVAFAVGAIWKLSQREKRLTGLGWVDRMAANGEAQYRDLKRRYL